VQAPANLFGGETVGQPQWVKAPTCCV